MLTAQESIAADLPKLTWRDAVWPVVLVVAGAAIVLYASSRFVAELFLYWFFFTSHDLTPIIAANLGVVVTIAVIIYALLARKARGRQLAKSYYAPPGIVALCFFVMFVSAAAREANQEEARRQYQVEANDVRVKMQDPTFLSSLKPPLSLNRRTAVISALDNGQRVVGTPLTSVEVHAILTNLGSDRLIDMAVAKCPATSVEDLKWLSDHGDNLTRQSLQLNPHTPDEILRRLIDDPDPDVRFWTGYGVAMHGCDVKILCTFWDREGNKDQLKNAGSFYALAGNACTPKDILGQLKTFPGDVGSRAEATLLALSTKKPAGVQSRRGSAR